MTFPSPGDLPDPGIEPGPPVLQADSLSSEPSESLAPNNSAAEHRERKLLERQREIHQVTEQAQGFPGGSDGKESAQEIRVQSFGQEDPLEKEIVAHSSIIAREISQTEEPGGLQSMGSQKSWTRLSS